MYGEINAGRMEMNETHGNLVEVMACEGGCISGPCVIVNPKKAEFSLKKYVEEGKIEVKFFFKYWKEVDE